MLKWLTPHKNGEKTTNRDFKVRKLLGHDCFFNRFLGKFACSFKIYCLNSLYSYVKADCIIAYMSELWKYETCINAPFGQQQTTNGKTEHRFYYTALK